MKWAAGAPLLVLALVACAPAGPGTRPDPTWYRAMVEPLESDATRFSRFCNRVLAMKGAELAAELEKSREAFDREKSELNRLQLALLLSLPGTASRDDAAALALLAPFARDKSKEGTDLRPFATWLHLQIVESRRLEETLQQQTGKLKDEQKRAEGLQQKLEALLDMEMKMIEREQTLPKKK